MNTFLNQLRLDDDTVRRLGDVLMRATENGDDGVADWVFVAMRYAVNGKLRDRDMNRLARLESVYSDDFYRQAPMVRQLSMA